MVIRQVQASYDICSRSQAIRIGSLFRRRLLFIVHNCEADPEEGSYLCLHRLTNSLLIRSVILLSGIEASTHRNFPHSISLPQCWHD